MQPEFDDEEPINPFDFWKGANFRLKLVKKDGYWNYDKSDFASPSILLDDDEELENVYNSLHDLNEFVNPKEFKGYDDLKKRLEYVLGIRGTVKKQDEETINEDQNDNDFSETVSEKSVKSYSSSEKSSSNDEDDEEDDALSYFAKLAEMD